MSFYTVDRAGTLSEGLVCQLNIYQDISPPELAVHVKDLFPDGVSIHGEQYFLSNKAQAMAVDPMLELLFEQVRRTTQPERPSRLQSMFAVETLDQARLFQSEFGGSAIYKVNSNVTFRANMRLLNAGNSNLATSWFAHLYWKGEAGPINLFWEYILKCPVHVGERVE